MLLAFADGTSLDFEEKSIAPLQQARETQAWMPALLLTTYVILAALMSRHVLRKTLHLLVGLNPRCLYVLGMKFDDDVISGIVFARTGLP